MKTTPLRLVGKPIVYSPVSYQVFDAGPSGYFNETMMAGCANDRTGKRDAIFVINHGAGGTLPLARESAGTLKLPDSSSALCMEADLDPASHLAQDLGSAVRRGDMKSMSVSFRVLDDEWSADWMNRTVKAIELFDVSAVNTPASPTTSISVLPTESTAKKKKWDDGLAGGADGTQNAPAPLGGVMGGDATGTRDKQRWNAERRAHAGGVERANLRGQLEVRSFTIWVPSAEVPVVAKRSDVHALQLQIDLHRLRTLPPKVRRVL